MNKKNQLLTCNHFKSPLRLTPYNFRSLLKCSTKDGRVKGKTHNSAFELYEYETASSLPLERIN